MKRGVRHLWPGFHSMRTRLVLWNALALALLLLLLGGVVQYSVETNLIASIRRELNGRIQFISRGIPNRMVFPPLGGMVIPRSNDARRNSNTRPRILTLEGYAYMPFSDDVPLDKGAFARVLRGNDVESRILYENELLLVLSHLVVQDGKTFCVIQAAHPLTEVNRAVAGLRRTLLTLVPVALLLAGIGAALLTGRVLRPIQQIAQTAGRIGAEDLSGRLPVKGRDEFAELAQTFNAMLVRLETAFSRQGSLIHQLEDAIEQQRRFTADASHELKTPLTIIKANASLTLRGTFDSAEYREAMVEVDSAADRMSRLVQDLLLLACADEGQLGRNCSRLLLHEILEQASDNIYRPGCASLRWNLPETPITLEGNAEELTRLFANLLENALRYTPPTGHITISAVPVGETLTVQIEDTGIGISEEHLAHLCERFYRVDPSRARADGGTGLGLAICQSIVIAHNGTLTIDSTVDVGTTVSITLPGA